MLAGPLQVGNLAAAMDIRVRNLKTMVMVALLGATAGLVTFLMIDVFGGIADNQGPIEMRKVSRKRYRRRRLWS
jgi:hypothetical protein